MKKSAVQAIHDNFAEVGDWPRLMDAMAETGRETIHPSREDVISFLEELREEDNVLISHFVHGHPAPFVKCSGGVQKYIDAASTMPNEELRIFSVDVIFDSKDW